MTPSIFPGGDSCLWERLQRYRFDPTPAAHPFERRLASAQRWPLGKASRVVEEYRRFVYLAVVADAAVTPSRAVDAAWHLHLIDSRRYWEEFCPVVLGRPLHHESGRGGPSDRAHHLSRHRGFVDRAMQMERLLRSNTVVSELTALNRSLQANGLRRTRGQQRRRLLLLMLPWLPLQLLLLEAVAALSQFPKQGPMEGTLALLALSLVLPAVCLARSEWLTPVGHRCRAEVHRQARGNPQPALEGGDPACPLRLVALGGMGVIATMPALASLAKAYTPCPGLVAAMRHNVWQCFWTLSWRSVGIGNCGGGGAGTWGGGAGSGDSCGAGSSWGGGDCGAGGGSSCGGGGCSGS